MLQMHHVARERRTAEKPQGPELAGEHERETVGQNIAETIVHLSAIFGRRLDCLEERTFTLCSRVQLRLS